MRDWPAHKWIGATLMALGVLHAILGLALLTR